MTIKQYMFARGYAMHGNAARAAREAGYSLNGVNRQGYYLKSRLRFEILWAVSRLRYDESYQMIGCAAAGAKAHSATSAGAHMRPQGRKSATAPRRAATHGGAPAAYRGRHLPA